MSLYIVEQYLPGIRPVELAEEVEGLRAAAERAGDVRYLGSTFVPEEESCFCRFDADSRDAVESACRLAGIRFARIVEAQTLPADDKEESWASSH